MTTRIVPALALAASMLLFTVPAVAAAPVVEHIDFAWNYNIGEVGPQPCPGVEVWDDETADITLTTFSDKHGNPIRQQLHAVGTDNFYNVAHPELRLTGHFVHNFWFDLRTGTTTENGVPYHITAPGYGTVLVEAGRWFADGRIVGKHSFSDPGDLAQFCALLTPQ